MRVDRPGFHPLFCHKCCQMEPRSLIHTYTHIVHAEDRTLGFMASIYLPFMLRAHCRLMAQRGRWRAGSDLSPPGWMMFCNYSAGGNEGMGCQLLIPHLWFNKVLVGLPKEMLRKDKGKMFLTFWFCFFFWGVFFNTRLSGSRIFCL